MTVTGVFDDSWLLQCWLEVLVPEGERDIRSGPPEAISLATKNICKSSYTNEVLRLLRLPSWEEIYSNSACCGDSFGHKQS